MYICIYIGSIFVFKVISEVIILKRQEKIVFFYRKWYPFVECVER